MAVYSTKRNAGLKFGLKKFVAKQTLIDLSQLFVSKSFHLLSTIGNCQIEWRIQQYSLSLFPFKIQSNTILQSIRRNNFLTSMNVQKGEKYRNFFSGLVSGIVSVTICNPLDITRTRLNIMNSPGHRKGKYESFSHTMRTIYKEQGLKGFYVGYRTNVVAIPLFNSIFFPIYEYCKLFFAEQGLSQNAEYLLSTMTAGSLSNIITNPIWVIRTRIMVQFLHPAERQYLTSSPTMIMFQLIREEGFGALFKGLSASLLSVSNACIYFPIYEQLKNFMGVNQSMKQFNSVNIMIASTIAKGTHSCYRINLVIASSCTYPLVVVRTVLHDHKTSHNGNIVGKRLGFWDVVRHIKQESGIKGFYGGLKPDLMRLIPSNAIMFVCYEYIRRYWALWVAASDINDI